MVSYMPETPEPMLESKVVASVAPVASIIMEPEAIPINKTTNTLIPIIPPIKTST